jgi:hypothetical protein
VCLLRGSDHAVSPGTGLRCGRVPLFDDLRVVWKDTRAENGLRQILAESKRSQLRQSCWHASSDRKVSKC